MKKKRREELIVRRTLLKKLSESLASEVRHIDEELVSLEPATRVRMNQKFFEGVIQPILAETADQGMTMQGVLQHL